MTPDDLSVLALVLLVVAAFASGWIDAVVGGGGLIQLPALVFTLPDDTTPSEIVGSNKVPSIAGTTVAALTYLRAYSAHVGDLIPLIAMSAVGAACGAQLTGFLDRRVFTPVVFAAVVIVAVVLFRQPDFGQQNVRTEHRTQPATVRLAMVGFAVGIWDGVMGPGTGTFFVILLVSLIGLDFLRANTLAKCANLTTNLAALAVFGVGGHVLWVIGGLMALGNLAGGYLGARAAISRGNAFIRRAFLVVVSLIALRLGWESLTLFTQ